MNVIGQRIGVYEITSLLGAGGMGEVYRARDAKLGRDVAIKVLPSAFTTDSVRRARFEREAVLLASLNHPNIATIHGIEQVDGVQAIVLELIDGETLHERLIRGPLPLTEALRCAAAIADALDAAHEKGIIHRDLKPSNIKITPSGTVKVLDFGLAKASGTGGGPGCDLTQTIAAEGADGRAIVGTAAYMSPEQARGQALDKRTDIWAFGCVLYEMLSGTRAFAGDTIPDTIAGILNRDVDWQLLPPETPEHVRRLIARCLTKDPRLRLRDIGDARLELAGDFTAAKPVDRVSTRRRMFLQLGIAVAFVTALTGVMFFRVALRPASTPMEGMFRFEIDTPPMPLPHSMAVSPNGRLLVFTGRPKFSEPPVLFVRAIGSLDSRPIPGTEHGLLPFWSPDSRSVGFWDAGGRKLSVLDTLDSWPRVLCATSDGFGGGAWNEQGTIVFSTPPLTGGGPALYRIPAGGGVPVQIVKAGRSSGSGNLMWPQFLADGRRFLYQATGNEVTSRAIFVGSLDGAEPVRLRPAESNAVFAPPNWLLFTEQRVLMAHPFDPQTLRFTGEAVPVASDISLQSTGRAAFAISTASALVYRTGAEDRSLVWVDRAGRVIETVLAINGRYNLALSPDGKRVAFNEPAVGAAEDDIFVHDIERKVTTRLTSDPAREHDPVWSPDSAAVAFDVHRQNSHAISARDASAAKPEWILVPPEAQKGYSVFSWSSKYFLFWKGPTDSDSFSGSGAFWAQRLSGDAKPFVYASQWAGGNAVLSPDNRWIAYAPREEGTERQIVVQSFPDSRQGRYVVSSKGGVRPRWSRDGRELFFVGYNQRLTAVSLTTNGGFTVHGSTELFTAPSNLYDVAPDGQKFLFNVASSAVGTPKPLVVVLNWMAPLKNPDRPASRPAPY